MERGSSTHLGPRTIDSEPSGEAFVEDDLAGETARAFAEANREVWDNPEENAAWADW